MRRARLGQIFPLAQAIALYADGLTLNQIGKQLGYSFSGIHKQLVAAGIAMRGRGGGRGSQVEESELYKKVFDRYCKKTTNCWPWTGNIDPLSGYGRVAINGKHLLAHRLAVMVDGRDPTGKLVCHHCDNPPCVNPAHLYIGTHKTNSLDMINRNRGATSKLTVKLVAEMRADLQTMAVKAVADKYGMDLSNTYKIKRRQIWTSEDAIER